MRGPKDRRSGPDRSELDEGTRQSEGGEQAEEREVEDSLSTDDDCDPDLELQGRNHCCTQEEINWVGKLQDFMVFVYQ